MIGIYRIENLVNHKNYIGQSIHIETRWKDHKRLAFYPLLVSYNYPLYRAIRKYGVENFKFSIIENCLEEELNEKECYWLSYYQSFGLKGYNQTPGGQGTPKTNPTEVITLFNSGLKIQELCELFSVNKITITDILHSAGLGYLTQEEKNILQPDCKTVEQYDLNGNLLNIYFSEGAAARAVNTSRSAISEACQKHNTSKNYIWKFQTDNISVNLIIEKLQKAEEERRQAVAKATLKRCSKEVNQYDLNGKYIQTFPSACEAGRSLNKTHGCIARVCRQEGKSSYGFIWRYVSDEYPKEKDLIMEDNN